jgi:hypothetical protein
MGFNRLRPLWLAHSISFSPPFLAAFVIIIIFSVVTGCVRSM